MQPNQNPLRLALRMSVSVRLFAHEIIVHIDHIQHFVDLVVGGTIQIQQDGETFLSLLRHF